MQFSLKESFYSKVNYLITGWLHLGRMLGHCTNKYDDNVVASALAGNWTMDTDLSERITDLDDDRLGLI